MPKESLADGAPASSAARLALLYTAHLPALPHKTGIFDKNCLTCALCTDLTASLMTFWSILAIPAGLNYQLICFCFSTGWRVCGYTIQCSVYEYFQWTLIMNEKVDTKQTMESTAKLLQNCLKHRGQYGDSEMGQFCKTWRISFFQVQSSNLSNRFIDKKP